MQPGSYNQPPKHLSDYAAKHIFDEFPMVVRTLVLRRTESQNEGRPQIQYNTRVMIRAEYR